MSPRRMLGVAVLVVTVLAAACQGAPSTLEPRGRVATLIADLWWPMLAMATVLFVVTMALLAFALWRPRSAPSPEADARLRLGDDRASRVGGNTLIIGGGVVVPLVVLTVLLVMTLRTSLALSNPSDRPALTIEVIGYQYWWGVRYPESGVVTANEVHIPAGRRVQLDLQSKDVIHSFWVPQLMGKLDMIPGRTNTTWVQADQPGEYWGECAEYCGLQHAKMAFVVVALPPDQFDAWLQRQAQPARQPTDPFLQRGAGAFAREGCIQCHAIRFGPGEPVGGVLGPDLTHVGSRRTLAAGMLANNLGNMAGWVGNPQAIKPGNKMPTLDLDSESLRAIAAYLLSLE